MADGAVAERFRGWLRERSLPVTPQRMAIAEVLLSATQHLSAEEVTRELSDRGMKAGVATVYRTLDVLVESGLVVERDFGEGFRRFEAARDVPWHEHLVCTSCGRVEECRDERIGAITAELAAARGFEPELHRLVIHGRCGNCRRVAALTRT